MTPGRGCRCAEGGAGCAEELLLRTRLAAGQRLQPLVPPRAVCGAGGELRPVLLLGHGDGLRSAALGAVWGLLSPVFEQVTAWSSDRVVLTDALLSVSGDVRVLSLFSV